MNKTQIREALNLKRDNKINTIMEHARDAEIQLLQNEVEANFGDTLKEIDKLLGDIKNKNKLIGLVECLYDAVENSNQFRLENYYYLKTFVSQIQYGFSDAIKFHYRNDKANKISRDRGDLIRKIESEYNKLDNMLVKMTANEFYNYLLSIGINLEIKETEKQQLPATIVNVAFL